MKSLKSLVVFGCDMIGAGKRVTSFINGIWLGPKIGKILDEAPDAMAKGGEFLDKATGLLTELQQAVGTFNDRKPVVNLLDDKGQVPEKNARPILQSIAKDIGQSVDPAYPIPAPQSFEEGVKTRPNDIFREVISLPEAVEADLPKGEIPVMFESDSGEKLVGLTEEDVLYRHDVKVSMGANGDLFNMASWLPFRSGETQRNGLQMNLVAIVGESQLVGYWIGQHPVTQNQYQRVMHLEPNRSRFLGENRPVENVSWEEAMDFCERLTKEELSRGIIPFGKHYALPSTLQWEFACAANGKSAFHCGDELSPSVACFRRSGNGDSGTVDVDSFEGGNRWDVWGMHGNVWEWCEDRDETKTARHKRDYRVRKGGCWSSAPNACKTLNSGSAEAKEQSPDIGFRVVLIDQEGR